MASGEATTHADGCRYYDDLRADECDCGRAHQTTPIGRLSGPPPYRAWELRADRRPGGPWGVLCGGGYNCFSGRGGAVFLPSREAADAVIRSHGHEPQDPPHG